MKKIYTILTLALLCISCVVHAQQTPKWEFGILADFGRDWYRKNYSPDIKPEWVIADFPNSVPGAGIYFERSFTPYLSVLGQLSYAQKRLHPQLFHFYSQTANYYYLSETHHRVAFDAGMRWYLNPQSKFKLFAEGKLGANVFVSAEQQEGNLGRIIRSNVFGYQRLLPVGSASVGFKWRRLTISAEYRDDLITAKRIDKRSEISGKGIFGKAAFTLFRVNEDRSFGL